VVKEIQLQLEYNPEPPFQAGSPRSAPDAPVSMVRDRIATFIARCHAPTEKAAERLAHVQLSCKLDLS
jgi:cyclohexyl-isocyanide hydratase